MKIVFFGTPAFSAQVLDYLLCSGVNIVAVVTKPDKPKGRSGDPVPSAVKALVQEKYPHIPLYQPALISAPGESDPLLLYQADLFVVVAYGEIIKQHLLDMPSRGCINVHTSLLPQYRGAAPIQQAIIHGESESGVTIMYMVKKMDAGDMIKTISVSISEEITFGAYEKLLCSAGSQGLLEVLRAMEHEDPPRTPQNHELATLAPKIELEDCQINWSTSALAIHNLVRGVNPYPGAWSMLEVKGTPKRLKIWKTRTLPHQLSSPGTILEGAKGEFLVATGSGVLQILELQLEGKKAMPAEELLRGLSIDFLCFAGLEGSDHPDQLD